MSLKDNYLKLSEKFGGKFAIEKKGIRRSIIESILKGRKINIYDAVIISNALGVTVEELVTGKPLTYTGTAEQAIKDRQPSKTDRVNEPMSGWDECEKDEKDYILKLIEIFQAKNKINIMAIKQNIDAFFASKDLDTE